MGELWLSETRGAVDLLQVIDVLPRSIIVTDPVGRIVLWNRQAELLYGWKRDEVIGKLVTDVLVALPDLDRATEILDTVRGGEIWSGDFTVLRCDGEPVRVWVTDRPIRDEAGVIVAIVGASEDVSEQRLLEQRSADLTEHLRLALDAGQLGTFRWDLATGATTWDPRLEALFGLHPGAFDGAFDTWVGMLHPDDRADVLRVVEAAVATKTRYTVEHRVVWPDGSIHWLHGSGKVTLDQDGNVTGTIGCTRDVTDAMLLELERQRSISDALAAAERESIHRGRLQFLADVNDALASSRNQAALMGNVARAAVPQFADWCSVYVLPTDRGAIPDIETAHVDPKMTEYARQLQKRFPYDPDAPTGMAHVIRTGEAEFYPNIDDALIEDLDATDDEREIVRELVLHSAIAVPLVKRDRVLGGLQFVMSKSSRHYNDDDLAVAQAVAARVASSLQNLRLSEAQRSIAAALQASLLPDDLADIPGIECAVRYWATGEGVDVGGDFYDLFQISDAEWAVVVGDVCGTGPTAAAVTGLARHTIASAAWHGDDPVAVLQFLNRTMRTRAARPFCTVLYGTLRPTPDGVSLRFACAGHPLPVVARVDAPPTLHGIYGTLIGPFGEISVTASTIDLHAGDAVVLYTDGVTDVAPPHGLTDAELLELVGRAAAGAESAEDLADRVEAELSAILPIEQRRDDIALLVLRVPD